MFIFLDQDGIALGSPSSDGEDRSTYDRPVVGFGRSLMVVAEQLDSFASYSMFYELEFQSGEEEGGFLCQVIADAQGRLPVTSIWPQLGFDRLVAGEPTFWDESKRWAGASLKIHCYVGSGFPEKPGDEKSFCGTIRLAVEGAYRLELESDSRQPKYCSLRLRGFSPQNFELSAYNAAGAEFFAAKEALPKLRKILSKIDLKNLQGNEKEFRSVWAQIKHCVGNRWVPAKESKGEEGDSGSGSVLGHIQSREDQPTSVWPPSSFPIIYHSDHNGSLKNGFEVGDCDLVLTVHGGALTRDEAERRSLGYRVFTVRHQAEWQVGDVINPVHRDRKVFEEVDMNESGEYVVQLFRREEIRSGNYDFIVRLARYAESGNASDQTTPPHEAYRVRPTDFVTRGAPGVVVRPIKGDNLVVGNHSTGNSNRGSTGLDDNDKNFQPNTQKIGGRRLEGAPYFKYSDVLCNRDDLHGAVMPSELTTKVHAKDGPLEDEGYPRFVEVGLVNGRQSRKLLDLEDSGRGAAVDDKAYDIRKFFGRRSFGRALPNKHKVVPRVVLKCQPQTGACIRFLLWPAAYPDDDFTFDLVARYLAGSFFEKGEREDAIAGRKKERQYAGFDWQTVLIDGFYRPGLRFVWDPAIFTSDHRIGYCEYSKRSVVEVDDDANISDERNNLFIKRNAKVRGIVYFPTEHEEFGPVSPAAVKGGDPFLCPLVVVIHGFSNTGLKSYLGYDYLLEHLAKNGFIAASIAIPYDFNIIGRANLIREHIEHLREVFKGSVSDQVGLVGHSRGGLAAIAALRLIQGDQYDIGAVVAIAPVDNMTARSNGSSKKLEGDELGPENMTLKVDEGFRKKRVTILYGSLDGQVNGARWSRSDLGVRTGFALYDRISSLAKTMVFVRGANHESFNREDGLGSNIPLNDMPRRISARAHEAVVKGYVTATLATLFEGKRVEHWDRMLEGDWVPPEVDRTDDGAVELQIQHRKASEDRVLITDFDSNDSENSSKPEGGGEIRFEGGMSRRPAIDDLYRIDPRSPHQTKALVVRWSVHRKAQSNYPRVIFAFNKPLGLALLDKEKVSLSFRIGRTYDQLEQWNERGADQDLFMALRIGKKGDPEKESERFIRVSKFARIGAPHEREEVFRGDFAFLIKATLSTVSIPLQVFIEGVEPIADWEIKAIVLDFRANESGELMIDDLEFTGSGIGRD